MPTSVRVGQLQRFITEPPTHRRLSGYVGVHYAPPPGLLKINLRCVTRGCHGDAFENGGRAEVGVLHVGAKM